MELDQEQHPQTAPSGRHSAFRCPGRLHGPADHPRLHHARLLRGKERRGGCECPRRVVNERLINVPLFRMKETDLEGRVDIWLGKGAQPPTNFVCRDVVQAGQRRGWSRRSCDQQDFLLSDLANPLVGFTVGCCGWIILSLHLVGHLLTYSVTF